MRRGPLAKDISPLKHISIIAYFSVNVKWFFGRHCEYFMGGERSPTSSGISPVWNFSRLEF